jgi:uncharacterized coiled-coil DUF342 family protein
MELNSTSESNSSQVNLKEKLRQTLLELQLIRDEFPLCRQITDIARAAQNLYDLADKFSVSRKSSDKEITVMLEEASEIVSELYKTFPWEYARNRKSNSK